MRRFLFIAILLAILAPLGKAQGGNTTVTAIIRDPNGALYTNSQVNITFFDPGTPGKQPLLNGSVFQTTYTIFATDSFGRFTQSVADNGIIDSSSGTVNTQWSFRVVYSDRATSFVYRTPINCAANIPATCTAGVMDISAQLQAVAALLPAQPGGGGSFVVRGPPCASTMNFQMAGTFPTTANTAFNVNLNCNVTSTSITQAGGGNVQVGAIAQFTLIEPNVAGFSFAWPSNFIDQPTIQQGSNQTTNASFWYDGTNWHAQTFPATGGGGGAVNAAIKPTLPGDPVQYVSPNGNDANDGLSWGTAKLTIYAALKALPGGSSTTAGVGTIWLSGTVSYGGPVVNQGMWLAGVGDPNYGSLPGGWLKSQGNITIDCLAIVRGEAHGHRNACVLSGGSNADSVHPVVWISSTNQPIEIKNTFFPDGLSTYVKYGIDSNNNRTGTGGASGFSTENIGWNYGSCAVGRGPGMDIGSNSFWIWMKDTVASGCGKQVFTVAASGAVRTGGITTIATTIANNIATGDIVTTQNISDYTFNASATATVVDSTHFTYPNPGPNTTSGTGQVITVGAAAIAVNPGSGSGSGLIFIDNINLNNGGIRFSPGTNGGGLYVNKASYEGDFVTPDMPPVLVTSVTGSNSVIVRVDHMEVADPAVTIPRVRVDNPTDIGAVVVDGVDYVSAALNPTGATPLRGGQYGFSSGILTAASSDAARRGFSPFAVRSANLAFTKPTSWTTTNATVTSTTTLAPDGTSGAGRVTGSGSPGFVNFYASNGVAIATGDAFIYGSWVRSVTANGFANAHAIKLGLNNAGFGSGDFCHTGLQSATEMWLQPLSSSQIDGQWQWVSGICRVIAAPNTAGLIFAGQVDTTHSTDFYGPTIMYIPTGTFSDNELWEMANNLSSYPNTASAGDVTMMPGQRFSMSTPGSNFFIKHIGTLTADRTVTWPDTSFTVPSGSPFTTNGVLFGNSTPVIQSTSAGGAGTLCLVETNGAPPTFASCSGSTSTSWSALTNPSADLSLAMGINNSLFTHGIVTGTRHAWEFTDGASTSTGSLFNLHTNAASTMKPFTATAGAANGVQMNTLGILAPIGTGGITANAWTPSLTASQLLAGNGGLISSLVGTLTGTNPVLTLTSALTTSVPFALNTPASPTADIFDLSINGSKTSWVDNLGIWHAPSYTATGSGALALSGTEGTCPSPSAGIDILCIGNLGTHTIQSSLNGANFKDNAQFSNSGPAAHGVCLVGSIFPQLNCTTAGTVGQAFVSGGAGADGFFGILGAVGGGTGNTTNTLHGVGMGEGTAALNFSAAGTAGQAFISGGAGADGSYGTFDLSLGTNTLNNLPINRGGTGAATLAAANIATVTGAITPNNCVKWSSATVITDSGGVCGGAGGSARLDQLLGGTAPNTINSTIFPQFWQWALTGSTTAFKFGENTAATGASNILLQASTLNTSTAVPFQTDSNGNGYQLNSSGLFKPIGTGALSTPGAAHNLIVSQAGSAAVTYIPPVTAGKVLIDNGPGVDPSFQDPIVSQAFVNLWTTQDVTTTRTSAAIRNPIFSQTGTLQLTWASITGSPATCTLQIQGVDSVGNSLNNGSTFSVSPANGITSQTFTAASTLQSAAQIKAIFACGVYPSTGTLTLEYTPIPNINVTNTVAISAASLPLPTGASTSAKQPALGTAGAASADVITVQGIASMTKLLVTPDSVALPANQSVNVNQVGGTAVDTNSGNKSAGTQRVVLATDQPNLTTPLNINKAQINGVTPLMGNGVTGTGSQRVTVASDNTPFETVPVTTATTTDTTLRCTLVSAASTNATNCKASAGNIYGYRFVNTTTTIYYLRMYNLTTSPTCSSATGFIESIPIPPAGTAGQAGGIVSMQPFGEGYGTGIAFCFTGGSSSTDNTNAAVGVFGTILYK